MANHGFSKTLSGRIVARLDDTEKKFLADLLTKSIELVRPADAPDRDPLFDLVGIEPDAQKPDDPALARILPDAYADDEEASNEFRRFHERDLRRAKVANAEMAMATLARAGDKLVISRPEAQAWAGALNDLRLVLGTRLGVTEDIDWDAIRVSADDDEAALHLQVYDWLTYLQEGLIQALMRT